MVLLCSSRASGVEGARAGGGRPPRSRAAWRACRLEVQWCTNPASTRWHIPEATCWPIVARRAGGVGTPALSRCLSQLFRAPCSQYEHSSISGRPIATTPMSDTRCSWGSTFAMSAASASSSADAANGAPYADAPSDVALTKSTGPGVNIDVVASSAADQTSWTGRLTVTIRPQLGTLEIVAPLARGEELLDAMDAPTTHAIRDALRHVTYHHTGKRPDTATRGVSFEVVDADGGTSAPAAFLVDILSVNDAPTLDLNGLHRGGTGYSSTMGEHERVLGVALVDADLYVGDADGTLIVRGRVAYDPGGVGYSATDFPVSLF